MLRIWGIRALPSCKIVCSAKTLLSAFELCAICHMHSLQGGSFALDLTITIGDITSLQSDGTPRANFAFLYLELQQPL